MKQYYTRSKDCTTSCSSDPNCKCWHDQGTGPFPEATPQDEPRALSWREKPEEEPLTIAEKLKLVADTISKFMEAHGGMGNGYRTYASGSIERSCIDVEVELPTHEDRTKGQIRSLNGDLRGELRKIEDRLGLAGEEAILIEMEHLEHGCCVTRVFWRSSPCRVTLP